MNNYNKPLSYILYLNFSDMESKSRFIVVVGSVNADIVVETPRLPLPGETLSASRPDTGTVKV